MAEAIPSSRESMHQKNVAMLMEKLKELQMSPECSSDKSRIYARIEGKHLQMDFLMRK